MTFSIQNVVVPAGIAALLALILLSASERDKQVNAWATAYEACVEREYGMTPATYYQNVGTYPPCEK